MDESRRSGLYADDPTCEVLQRALDRERRARRQSETIAEQTTRQLFLANEELQERQKQQASVWRLAEAALEGRTIQELLELAAHTVAHTLGVELCGVFRALPGAPSELQLVAGTGWAPGEVGVARIEVGDGSLARHALGSATLDEDQGVATEGRYASEPLLARSGVRSGAMVIIPARAGPPGLLGAYACRQRRFSVDDTRFMRSIATTIAIAIHRHDTELALRESEERLHHAQKVEAVGRLAGGLAHDLNNLLTVLIGHATMLASPGEVPPEILPDVEGIRRAADRAASLVHQLQAFGRKQILRKQTLDVNAFVQETHAMLGQLLGEKVELRLDLAPDAGRIFADKGELELVLVNLGINARDAMAGSGIITIATRSRRLDAPHTSEHLTVPPGTYVELTVSDAGPALNGETLAHIFEPFYARKGLTKGSGLGLATVHGIVAQSGGTITVESAAATGTSFRILLPSGRADTSTQAQASGQPATREGPGTVLVVDDQAEIVRMVARTLLNAGLKVHEAVGVGEALVLLERRDAPIDLLITDIVMPRMNGRELALKACALRPKLKVLYMSGETSGVIDPADLDGSTAAFIAKPFSTKALIRQVHALLEAETPPR